MAQDRLTEAEIRRYARHIVLLVERVDAATILIDEFGNLHGAARAHQAVERDRALKAALAVTGAWIAFYFHRNDLYIEAILIKHVVYISAASMLLAWLWHVAPQFVRAYAQRASR